TCPTGRRTPRSTRTANGPGADGTPPARPRGWTARQDAARNRSRPRARSRARRPEGPAGGPPGTRAPRSARSAGAAGSDRRRDLTVARRARSRPGTPGPGSLRRATGRRSGTPAAAPCAPAATRRASACSRPRLVRRRPAGSAASAGQPLPVGRRLLVLFLGERAQRLQVRRQGDDLRPVLLEARLLAGLVAPVG